MKVENDAYLPLFLTETLYPVCNKGNSPSPSKKTASSSAETTTPIATEEAKATVSPALDWMGENRKGVGILVSYEQDNYIPDAHRELLGKILQAVQLDWTDIALINLSKVSHTHPGFADIGANRVLSFGVNHSWVPTEKLYQKVEFQNRTVLKTHTLEEIAQSRDLKVQLWTALKSLFS